jgi:ABC-type nitrate/sulfonate/bicarbonate transport system permease component
VTIAPTTASPWPDRLRRFGRTAMTLSGVAIVAVVWIVGGRAGWARGMVVTPAEAVRPIVGSSHDVYLRATKATAWEAVRGLVIGSLIAFVLALLAGTIPALRRSITRLAAIANAAPWVAVAPCLLVILGRDRGPVAVAALAVFFFVFVSTTVGLGAAPAAAHDVATALGMSPLKRVWTVQLPACWPSVVDGLRLAAPAALAGAVFGEWYGAPRGLGVLLIGAMQSGRPERLWAASLLSAACGLAAFALLGVVRTLLVRRFGRAIAQAPPPRSRAHGRGRVLAVEAATAVGLAAALVFAWWLWVEVKDISPLVVPRPSAAWHDIEDSPGVYVDAAGATLLSAAIAFGIGAGTGLVAAVAATRARVLAGMIVPVVVVLAATPLVALFPLFARVFGYQPNTVRLLAALMVFFPVFVYARSGLSAASAPTLDVVDALGGTAGTRFRLVVLPAAIPHIVSGARIAAGSAVIAAVVGESLIGRDGLGVQFSRAYRLLELPRAFGAAIVIVIVSVAVFAAAGWVERVVHARWT